MRARTAFIVSVVFLFCGACADREGYPRLSDVPDRPATTLTPERSEALSEELRAAREDASSHAAEGREGEGPSDEGSEEGAGE